MALPPSTYKAEGVGPLLHCPSISSSQPGKPFSQAACKAGSQLGNAERQSEKPAIQHRQQPAASQQPVRQPARRTARQGSLLKTEGLSFFLKEKGFLLEPEQ